MNRIYFSFFFWFIFRLLLHSLNATDVGKNSCRIRMRDNGDGNDDDKRQQRNLRFSHKRGRAKENMKNDL